MTKLNALIIEDDAISALALSHAIQYSFNTTTVNNSIDALNAISKNHFDLIFIDLDLESPLSGLNILKIIDNNNSFAVIISGREEESIIRKCYELKVHDYLCKPFSTKMIQSILKKVSHHTQLKSQPNLNLKSFVMTNDALYSEELRLFERAFFSEKSILLTGESGTGKTHIAKYLHNFLNKEAPFIHLNCAELPESTIESELFGHEKGAFTGAHKEKKGLIELANGGTLFLDEIGTIPLAIQKKLLNVLEEKSFYPMGSEKLKHSHFRLISATCDDLSTKIVNKEFREDLYFRIEGHNLQLKPLRERACDLLNLINFFIKKGERQIIFEDDAKQMMLEYSWPGNIRELEKTISILQSLDNGIISSIDLNKIFSTKRNNHLKSNINFNHQYINSIGLPKFIEEIEYNILISSLANNHQKVRKTISGLQINNNTYYRIMRSDIHGKERSINS